MANDHLSSSRSASHAPRRADSDLDGAWDDPREARLRKLAPVYLGHSAATRAVQSQIHRALEPRGPVLVSGAPGTGKRTVAEILHHFSDAEGPLEQVTIVRARGGRIGDLSSRPGRRGVRADLSSRPGARADLSSRPGGRAELAYLCPLEELTLGQQGKLLEVIGLRRVVLGTRLELDGAEARARLHPRLLAACSIRIELPTLRRRIDDLEALTLWIIGETPSRRPVGGIDDDALACLRAHPWRGNVTELEGVLRAAIEVGSGEQIELRDLPSGLRLRAVESLELGLPDIEFSLAHAERSAIERAMRYARANKRKAARLLKISKTTLYRKLRQYDGLDDLDGLDDDDDA